MSLPLKKFTILRFQFLKFEYFVLLFRYYYISIISILILLLNEVFEDFISGLMFDGATFFQHFIKHLNKI